MAIELGVYKIPVKTVMPSTSGIAQSTGRPHDEMVPPQQVPLGRWGRTIDQSPAVLFLASPDADFIMGADLPVDGGVLAVFPTWPRA